MNFPVGTEASLRLHVKGSGFSMAELPVVEGYHSFTACKSVDEETSVIAECLWANSLLECSPKVQIQGLFFKKWLTNMYVCVC